MQIARVNKSVKRVVHLQKDSNGQPAPVVVYKRTGEARKGSSALRPLEKAVRRVMKAESAALDSYLDKHERSNQKNKNGWLRDMVPNVVDSAKKGKKKLRLDRIVMMK